MIPRKTNREIEKDLMDLMCKNFKNVESWKYEEYVMVFSRWHQKQMDIAYQLGRDCLIEQFMLSDQITGPKNTPMSVLKTVITVDELSRLTP